MKTHVLVSLDRSSSMASIRNETVDAFNAQVAKLKEAARDHDTSVSLVTFGSGVETVFFAADPISLGTLGPSDYRPDGLTALFDGVALPVERLLALPDANDEETSFLVITLTDGGENNSSRYAVHKDGAQRLVNLLRRCQDTDRWTFAFLMPPGAGKRFADQFGIPEGNIREWQATREGTHAMSQATNVALGSYFTARKAGQRSVAAFYHTTDLSKVDRATIHGKLKDISGYFRVFEVPKEARIDEFLTEKTKQPYVVGAGYYQLMKRELIQPHKKVLIMEKGQKAIWGGPEARDLIGLPDDADAKVTPGNHSNYDIFVQSKAPNRKLPRGTRVIFDPSHTHESSPTWDYEEAYAVAEKKRAEAAASSVSSA